MPPEMSYRSDAGERSHLRRWLFVALLASLLLHAGLGVASRFMRLERFNTVTQRLVPRAFTVKQLEIDPALLEEPRQEPEPQAPRKTDTPPDIMLPEEPKPFEELINEVRATPAVTEPVQPVAIEEKGPNAESFEIAKQLHEQATGDLEKSLDSLTDELAMERPTIKVGELLKDAPSASASAEESLASGYSNLDALLAQSGVLKAGTAPILMPTDLLFEYDSADLRPSALDSMQKLGKIIARNPNSVFTIEGHSDSYGSAEYNQDLSLQRAEKVKEWLIYRFGISDTQVRTKGYGSTRLIAPSSGSIEEQQINRRVEIVIHAPR